GWALGCWGERFQAGGAGPSAETAAAQASAVRAPSSSRHLAYAGAASFVPLSPCGRGSTARSAGGVRGALAEGTENRSQHSFQIRQHVVVPEPQHHEIVRGEPPVTPLISPRVGVLPAVYFDNDACGVTHEIGDKRSNRHLPAELEICKAPVPQREPQPTLGIGHA